MRESNSFRVDEEGLALVVVLLLVVAINVYLVRRLVGPVQGLTALAHRVDFAGHGERMPVSSSASEADELASTFNEMLARLEAERREATGRVLAGQEAERLRIAQELHDQVGQELTAVLLGLARVQARVPAELRTEVDEVHGAVPESLEESLKPPADRPLVLHRGQVHFVLGGQVPLAGHVRVPAALAEDFGNRPALERDVPVGAGEA